MSGTITGNAYLSNNRLGSTAKKSTPSAPSAPSAHSSAVCRKFRCLVQLSIAKARFAKAKAEAEDPAAAAKRAEDQLAAELAAKFKKEAENAEACPRIFEGMAANGTRVYRVPGTNYRFFSSV